MKRAKHISIFILILASPAFAKNVEKRAQQLWQKTPLLLRSCPPEGPAIVVWANGQVAGTPPAPSHDFCLLEFSSVKQAEEAVILSGRLTEATAEGDDLTLKPIKQVEPFQISIQCPKKTAVEENLDFFDRALFSHAELNINAPARQYFRRIVEQYLGLAPPAPRVAVVTPPQSGSNISQASFVHAPQLRRAPDPSYSSEARSRRIEGTVVVWMIVDKDGHTRDFQVTKPVGYGLDEQAVKAVREWTFDPATKDKQPVAVAISVEVNFHLY